MSSIWELGRQSPNFSVSVQSFFKLFKPKSQRSSKNKSGLEADVCMGLEISSQGLSCAVVAPLSDRLALKACRYLGAPEQQQKANLLKSFVDEHDLMGQPCTLVLDPSDYKLLLVEAPNVPLEKLNQIMPDRVEDLIPWDAHETVLDVMTLPDDAYQGRRNMVYVAAAKKITVLETVALTNQAGLIPESIDIQEMAVRNVSLVKGVAEESHAVLRLKEKEGLVVLMFGNQVYLTRRISVSLETLRESAGNEEAVYGQLAAELQRSIDYYETQMGKGAVLNLTLLSANFDFTEVVQFVDEQLSAKVAEFDIFHQLHAGEATPYGDRGLCMSAVGVAARGFVSDSKYKSIS